MFPQPPTDLFTSMFLAFGYSPHRSPHVFPTSYHLPALAHVSCSQDKFLYSTPPAMGTLRARVPIAADGTHSVVIAQYDKQ